MKRFNSKRMYLPALSIVMAVLIMLVLIGVSTYRNLDRDQKKAMIALRRQGVSLLHALEAGVRAGTASGMGVAGIEDLIRETARSDDIAYLYLVDANGAIIYHSNSAPAGKRDLPPVETGTAETPLSRMRQVSKGLRVFELAGRFSPVPPGGTLMTAEKTPPFPIPAPYSRASIVLGLKMTEFETAHHSDLHHALIMAAILVALGSGALYFIFVIQNYYLVDKALTETRDYTRQVVASMANGLVSINSQGEIASYNLLALDLLDLKEENVTGMDLRTLIDFDLTGVSETLTHCRSILDHEITYQRKSGEVIPLSLSVSPISNENTVCSGAVIVLRDLREIKRLEATVRRSEKLAAIGELAAGVAHEIRNPLSSIKGFAQFLRHSLKDRPEEREYADVMVREVDRINRVVTDLLTYARPLSIDRAPVNLPELVHHSLRLVRADSQCQNVAITSFLSDDLEGIWLDANQITQALLNLLLNSLQAVSVGGKIEVGAAKEDSGRRVHLWVEDNGAGIPPEAQGKIFDPFFTTRDKGTGLGLAIVHKIVENHQGEIRIHSPVTGKGTGTIISLFFPLFVGEVGKEA
jgi:two-component system sensor histidine kinase HydH